MADGKLDWLGAELVKRVPNTGSHVVLFGSAVMLLHGLREQIGDVDVFVTPQAFAHLHIADGWTLQFPGMDDPPLLEWKGGEVAVHAFERWTSRDWWINVREVWERRELVAGWPCAPLEIVSRWKRQAAKYNAGSERHEKHLRDADVIDKHLEAQRATA